MRVEIHYIHTCMYYVFIHSFMYRVCWNSCWNCCATHTWHTVHVHTTEHKSTESQSWSWTGKEGPAKNSKKVVQTHSNRAIQSMWRLVCIQKQYSRVYDCNNTFKLTHVVKATQRKVDVWGLVVQVLSQQFSWLFVKTFQLVRNHFAVLPFLFTRFLSTPQPRTRSPVLPSMTRVHEGAPDAEPLWSGPTMFHRVPIFLHMKEMTSFGAKPRS